MRTSEKVALAVVGLALSVALSVARGARGDDAFKWNPAQKPVFKAGTRFCEELTKTETRVLKFMDEGKTNEEKHEGKESIRLVHAVAHVSSAGVTEDRISVERWSLALDKDVDSCLEGGVLVVKSEGPLRAFTAESEKPVTRFGNRWVAGHIIKDGKREPTLDELDWDFILPKEPLAEGGTWTIDPAAFAREVMGPTAAIDTTKSKGSGKLASVKVDNGVHFGHVEVEVSLALQQLGTNKVAWQKGGVQEFRYVLDLSLEPQRRDVVAAVITVELAGRGNVTLPGRDLDLELDEKSRLEVRRSPVE